MAAGDITQALLDELGLRLEDPAEGTFLEAAKLTFLNKAQKQLCNLLHDAYLTELESIETNKTLTSNALALSSLNSGLGVLRGGKGIKKVAVDIGGATGNVWAHELNVDELKKTENQFLAYSDTAPMYYIFDAKINVLVTTYTSTVIDVFFLKMPTTMTTSVDPVINKALYNVMVTLAEAMLWGTDSKLERRDAAADMAQMEIDILNSRYRRAQGVGTKNREREEFNIKE